MLSDELDAGAEGTAPVWAVFGDLMAGPGGRLRADPGGGDRRAAGAGQRLKAEVQQRQAEAQRRLALEQALAGPLAAGRVTLANGRIGISGSVLFAFNSDQLQPEGRQLLKSLAAPLAAYLASRDELLMVSGFTDDRQVREAATASSLTTGNSRHSAR
jgi:outer membrane protein OmpA-like peptidoglycan-associated protein